MPIRFGSVCSGIEAASVAWNPLGWRAAWFSEIERFPCELLKHKYPSVTNLGDMTKIADMIKAGTVEAPDLLCGGTPCFVAGTMVLTETGYRPIEDIRVGDYVVTHKGRLRRVSRIGSKDAVVGKLSLSYRDDIICTPNHPFLAVNHSVRYKRKSKCGFARIETTETPEWRPAHEMNHTQWCSLRHYSIDTPCIESTKFATNPIAFYYLCGAYLGDGWIRGWNEKTKKAVVFGLNEQKVAKLLSVVDDARVGVYEGGTCFRATIHDTKFANFLAFHFGKTALRKTLPPWVMSLPTKYREAFVNGYIDTDGCRSSNGLIRFSTVSRSLAFGIADLMQTLGHTASVKKYATKKTTIICGRTVNQRDLYQVRAFPLKTSKKSRILYDYLCRNANSFHNSAEIAIVYNLEVEEDHSYIVNGAIVHNCQAFSIAGMRKSLDDSRGQLSLEFVRLFNAIDEKRIENGKEPSVCFWENVPGCLSTKDNAFGCFLGALAGSDEPIERDGSWPKAGCAEGPQRRVAWRVLDAQHFGVPQRRKRVFVVASARKDFDPAEVLFESEGLPGSSEPCGEVRQGVSRNPQGGVGKDGVNERVLVINDTGGGFSHLHDNGLCPTLRRANSQKPLFVLPYRNSDHEKIILQDRGGDHMDIGTKGIAPTPQSRMDGHVPSVLSYWCRGDRNSKETDTAITLDRNCGHLNVNQGSTVIVQTVSTALHGGSMTESDTAGTLRRGCVFNKGGDSALAVVKDESEILRVRRLTPVECERLMGFPDNYTRIPYRGKAEDKCPDTPRYAALGNSWAVPVIRWIGERLQKQMKEATED